MFGKGAKTFLRLKKRGEKTFSFKKKRAKTFSEK